MLITMHGSYLQSSSQSSDSSNQDSNVVPTLLILAESSASKFSHFLPVYLSKADGVSTEVVKLHCMVESTCE